MYCRQPGFTSVGEKPVPVYAGWFFPAAGVRLSCAFSLPLSEESDNEFTSVHPRPADSRRCGTVLRSAHGGVSATSDGESAVAAIAWRSNSIHGTGSQRRCVEEDDVGAAHPD